MKICQNCTLWRPNSRLHDPNDPLKLCHKHDRLTDDGDTCDDHLAPDATVINVPQHTAKGTEMPAHLEPVIGPTHILIVTYSKDLPWMVLAAKCLQRHASGFNGITVACPRHEAELFHRELNGLGVSIHPYTELNGRGMIQHMAVMATADEIVPDGTAFVLHMDSDCMVHSPITPEHYIKGDKPDYLFRTYDSLIEEDPRNPGSKVISDCHQWKEPTERQLGMKVEAYTMCRHPTVFPIHFYSRYRNHIAQVQGKTFFQYMVEGRNAFPQDRMDFTAMGAFAFSRMHSSFRWIDISASAFPKDRMKAYHSHSGISEEIRREIEGFLA